MKPRLRISVWLLASVFGLAALPGSVAGASPLAQHGKALYGRYCVACHGANGSGISRERRIGAAPLRAQTIQGGVGPSLRGVGARSADFYLRTGYMPLKRVGTQPRRSRVLLGEQEIRALVSYVASLAPGPPIPRPEPQRGNLSEGQHLFADHCAGCHQIVAQGGVVSGAVSPPLRDATAVQIAQAVRIGPYVMPTFSRKAISNRQLDSIIRYVEFAKHPDNRGGWAIGYIGPVPEGLVTWFIAATVLVALCVVIGRRLRSAA